MDLTTIIIGAGIFMGAGAASYASTRAARNGEYKMLTRIEEKVDRLDGRMDAFASRLDRVEERINADS